MNYLAVDPATAGKNRGLFIAFIRSLDSEFGTELVMDMESEFAFVFVIA